MLPHTFRLSKHLSSSQATAVGCSCLRSAFASQSDAFADEAKTFVKAAATLKNKPDRTAQVKAFAESKEAARRIAEKMSGEAINWQKEETKARNNLKRKMMEWGKHMFPVATLHGLSCLRCMSSQGAFFKQITMLCSCWPSYVQPEMALRTGN